MKFDTIDEILDYAIGREQQASDFYTGLADKIDNQAMKQIFLDFANEEKGHKAKLMAVKKGQKLVIPKERVQDLKIGDYLADVDPGGEIDYQAALTLAMKSEKEAFQIYNGLAESSDDLEMKQLFNGLAQEEAKHKLRFELEYDKVILKDN